jgi:hypothetical protein
MTTPSSTMPAPRRFVAALIGAATFLPMSGAIGQIQQGVPGDGRIPGNAQPARAPVDPQNVSCNDLKDQVKAAGELSILAGPRNGWGDTFYGPAVPRCQFYQMPQFAYVRARDGLCGVGYICIDKISFD